MQAFCDKKNRECDVLLLLAIGDPNIFRWIVSRHLFKVLACLTGVGRVEIGKVITRVHQCSCFAPQQ
jgi:hypothetical protein